MNWLVVATPWLAALFLVTSPLFAYTAGPGYGYGLFMASVLMGLVGSPVNAWLAWKRRERLALLRAAVAGVPVVLALIAGCRGAGHPMINDVSTNLQDPPSLRVNGQEIPFPESARQALERSRAPEAWIVRAPLDEVQRTLLAVIATRDEWSLDQNAPGTITFVATSRLFRFKDDVVVRLRAEGDGTRVDVRSRSRMGKGDFGANRKRIRELLNAARALLAPPAGPGVAR